MCLTICSASPVLAQVTGDGVDRQARAEAERFAGSVVRVLPQQKDGTPAGDQGFGLIVGRRGPDLYVVTPSHVVFDRDQMLNDRPLVRFRVRPGDDVEAVRLPYSSPQTYDDLAVLMVRNAADRSPTVLSGASLQAPRDAGSWVWTIGRETGWSLPGSHGSFSGTRDDPKRQVFNGLPTAPGSSGAAVVTVDGIVGMVVSNTSGAIDTFAVSIDEIKDRLRGWDLPTDLVEVGRDCDRVAPPGTAPPSEKKIITFDGLPGPDGSLLNCYTEGGFTVAPASGNWLVGKSFGHPLPYIYFTQRATEYGTTTNSIAVTASGHTFTFTSADLYASVTPIPYVITGFLDRNPVFKVAGIVPNTFGNFATVQNAYKDVAIDRLEIEISTFTRYAVASPAGIDNLVVSRK
ncbi:MAG TPA: serine protease [Terriglobia bacterium]|nr:serine protease [Terriglobia bacterium]